MVDPWTIFCDYDTGVLEASESQHSVPVAIPLCLDRKEKVPTLSDGRNSVLVESQRKNELVRRESSVLSDHDDPKFLALLELKIVAKNGLWTNSWVPK